MKKLRKDKYIKTALYKMGEMLIIRIENSCTNQLEYNDKKIKSTKKNHFGIGLYNVKETVEKYKGIFNINIFEENCRIIITIPLK